MGAPMLRALIRAGFPAKGFDIAPKSDADITTDVAAFADGLETLITVVRDTAQTDQVLLWHPSVGPNTDAAPDHRQLVPYHPAMSLIYALASQNISS